jgi:hypothetical protein
VPSQEEKKQVENPKSQAEREKEKKGIERDQLPKKNSLFFHDWPSATDSIFFSFFLFISID